VGAGVVFAAIPMVQIVRGDLSPVFRTGGRGGTASHKAVYARNAMGTSQVALAFVLLIGAGLMLVSFRAALSVDPGFDPAGVLTAFVSLPGATYPTRDARRQFTDQFVTQVKAIPGVTSAAVTSQLPFSGSTSSSVIFPEGYVPKPGESVLSPRQAEVSPDYFATMGIEVLEGLLTRLVQSLLFGVQATDLRVMGAVALVLGLVGLVACLIPARRATAVDPVSALGGV
jgi:putative ABC transport system permease protein